MLGDPPASGTVCSRGTCRAGWAGSAEPFALSPMKRKPPEVVHCPVSAPSRLRLGSVAERGTDPRPPHGRLRDG